MKYRYITNGQSLGVDPAACNGCGTCLEVCPHGVFEIEEHEGGKKTASIADRDSCMECGACQTNCPRRAITVERGVGCAAAVIMGMLTGKPASCGCGCGGGDAKPGKKKKTACC
jgi:NAD-dependent dihydropyrimidine dehydrogenase PreA subunit